MRGCWNEAGYLTGFLGGLDRSCGRLLFGNFLFLFHYIPFLCPADASRYGYFLCLQVIMIAKMTAKMNARCVR